MSTAHSEDRPFSETAKWVVFLSVAFTVTFALVAAITAASRQFESDAAIAAASLPNPSLLKIRRQIAGMGVAEKIGQLMMVSIPDQKLSERSAAWLEEHQIGGVILLGRNVKSAEQVQRLTADLGRAASRANMPTFFIAVDQEGGSVVRFPFLAERTAQRDIIKEDQAFDIARRRGRELAGLGVNVNFSPVLDIAVSREDFIYPRTFRGDARAVANLGQAMIRGYRAGGVLAVAKHFPGHGGTGVDSHRALPGLLLTNAELSNRIEPFRAAISEGIGMIMAGHLNIPAVDSERPASLSRSAVAGLLRQELVYNGVVITDDLGMGAITNSYALPDAAVMAVQAGADIVLVVSDFETAKRIHGTLRRAVEIGVISERRIDESVRRILLLKGALKKS